MSAYTVAPANLVRDRDAILRLWADNFVHATEARYDWLYDRHALGEPSCVLLKTAADAAVGVNALLPRTVQWSGETRVFGQAVDLAVDREHRAAGPALRLQKGVLAQARECGMPAVYGFPLPAAEALLRRAGYRQLGAFHHWFKLLQPHLGPGGSRGGIRRAAGVATMLCRVARSRVAELAHPLPRGWRTDVGGELSADFDRLWQTAALQQFDVLGERSAAFLRARFLTAPKGSYALFRMIDEDQRMTGYVLFDRRKERVAKVVDALAAAPALWAPLVAAFSRQARRDGVGRIEFPLLAPGWLEITLAKVGFRARRNPGPRSNNRVMVYQDKTAAPALTGTENWLLTFADTDAD